MVQQNSQQPQQMRRDGSAPAFSQSESVNYNLDIDNFVEFESSIPYLSPAATRSSFSSSPSSANNTPHMSRAQPAFSGPSHPYELHQQQTAIPMVGGMGFDDELNNDVFMMGNDSTSLSSSSALPAFFYPENMNNGSDSMVQGISPSMMSTMGDVPQVKREPQTPAPAPRVQPVRPQAYYAGIHQEMYNQKMEAQRLAQQQAVLQQQQQQQRASVPSSNPKDEQINTLLNSMRVLQPSAACLNKTSNTMPHIAKLKKEEDEMDEDERLLASEEGKKLSSKERRQLRNKVSARAFRSRRKEYIAQLEGEVAAKSQENVALQHQVDMQRQQIEKLEGFLRNMLAQPAFNSVVDSMVAPLMQQPAQESRPAPAPRHMSISQPRDVNPNIAVSGPEEWPLAYGSFNMSQVFTVEVPEAPAVQDLDGKLTDDFDSVIPPVADGFFAGIRDEKANLVDFEPMPFEDDYEAPENIMDLFEEEYSAPVVPDEKEEAKSLDEMFPGTDITLMLSRLEMIAGGQAKPEDFFEVEKPEESAEEAKSSETAQEVRPVACATSSRLNQMESLYRRIGLVCGGN